MTFFKEFSSNVLERRFNNWHFGCIVSSTSSSELSSERISPVSFFLRFIIKFFLRNFVKIFISSSFGLFGNLYFFKLKFALAIMLKITL